MNLPVKASLERELDPKFEPEGPPQPPSDFYRIKRLPPYVFETVNRLKQTLRAQGADVIDLGMGNPDMPPPPHVIEKLVDTARKPDVHGYSSSKGVPGLRRAIAGYYQRRFGVKLDPESEVVVTMGSKEGFANLAQAITAPGDVVLCPDPAYPIHAFGFLMAGGVIRAISAPTPEAYLAGISRAVKYCVPAPTAMVVNYPSNPTAQAVELDFYKEVLRLARAHDLLVLSDMAYSEIYFDETKPTPSILEVDGARERAVEINSMSKTYAMAGWRIGMVVGNARLCAALVRVKSYLDYGAFTPIQVAAVAALNGPQHYVDEIRGIYKARRDVLVESFGRAGWTIPTPPASMFAWAPIPERYRAMGSVEFAKLLLEKAHVAVAPGAGFGEGGEGFVRIGLVENEQRIRQAAREVKRMLAGTEAAA
jgi:alanine-synthesizing transaminase